MAKRNNTHDETIDRLVNKLRQEDYDVIEANKEYYNNGYDGEFDVYARKGKTHYYFEVKSTQHHRSRLRAREQFQRARDAYPNRNWKFYLVTPDTIEEY